MKRCYRLQYLDTSAALILNLSLVSALALKYNTKSPEFPLTTADKLCHQPMLKMSESSSVGYLCQSLSSPQMITMIQDPPAVYQYHT